MALREQDVNIRGEKRSYSGLLRMVNLVINANRLNRNKAALDSQTMQDFIQLQNLKRNIALAASGREMASAR